MHCFLAGKSIVLCWLITDFSTDQAAQINAPPHLPGVPRGKLQLGFLPSFSGFILLRGWPRDSKRNRKTAPHPEPRFHTLEPGVWAPPPPLPVTRWRWRPVFASSSLGLKSEKVTGELDVECWKFMKVNLTILALHAVLAGPWTKGPSNEWKYATCPFIYDTANLSTHSFQTSTSRHFCV